MKIQKVINNNVVSCIDDTGRESVAMGKGLGFGSRPGMELQESRVEKIFHMASQSDTDRLKDLYSSLSEEQIELCNRIIAYAAEVLGKKLNPSLYLTLTDHVSFAISRMKQGIVFQNALLTEVKTFYPREYAVGEYAIALIEKEMGVEFAKDEAASIALHIVNAESDASLSETVRMTHSLHEILEILRQSQDITLMEDSPYFDELTVHLKFLVLRVFSGDEEERQEPEFVQVIRDYNPQEYRCAELVAEYLEKQCRHTVSDETKAYLAVHIRRINANYVKKEGKS